MALVLVGLRILIQRQRSCKMPLTYEKIETENYVVIKATDENGIISWIPLDPANSDYQKYLAANEPNEL